MRLHVVVGNEKLGSQVHNVSLMPRQTCRAGVPCAKPGQCYALKPYWMARKNIRVAWGENTALALYHPLRFWGQLHAYMEKHEPKWFRFHVAGDFPDQIYLNRAFELARMHPKTKFLAFTKRFEFSYAHRPKNFSIVFSAWPGMKVPRGRFPICWVDDGNEPRIPKKALRCPGSCEQCMSCWHLGELERDVVVEKHR